MDNNLNEQTNENVQETPVEETAVTPSEEVKETPTDVLQSTLEYDSQPYVATNVGGGSTPPKKPASTGKIIGIVAACVAAIALIVCGILFIPKLFKSDKEVVEEAFEASYGTEAKGYFLQKIDEESFEDLYFKEGGKANFEITLNSITGVEQLEALNGLAISCDANINMQQKLANADLALKSKDESLLSLNYIYSPDTMYMQVPELFDGYLTIPTHDMFGELMKAPIMEGAVDAEELASLPKVDLDLFAMIEEMQTIETSSEDGLWAKATVKKDGSETVDVCGESIKAKKYIITFAEADLEAAVNSVFDEVSEQLMSNPSALESSGMNVDTFNQSMTQVKNMLASMITDIECQAYVKDDELVKLTSTGSFNVMGVVLDYDVHFDLADDAQGEIKFSAMGQPVGIKYDIKDVHGNANGTVSLYAASDSIDFNFNCKNEKSDSSEVTGLEGTLVVQNKDVCKVAFNNTLNKSDDSFKGDFTITVDDQSIGVAYSGSVKDIEKGKSYTYDIPSIDIMYNGSSVANIGVKIGGSAGNADSVSIDSSIPVYDITKVTAEELTAAFEGNQEKIMKWAEDLSAKFGGLGSSEVIKDIEEDVEEIEEEVEDENSSNGELIIQDYDDHKVKILGTMDGFTQDYVCEWFITFTNPDYSSIEYSMENYSVDEIVSGLNDSSSEYFAGVETSEVEVDGTKVQVAKVTYNYDSFTSVNYIYMREIADGVILKVTVVPGEETATAEDYAEVCSDKYFEILQ